ncbi:MAG: thiolase family protein [Gammaproteobacteria bacterium]|nr:thiolase family protein [Gammaproteobacteria bacterium]
MDTYVPYGAYWSTPFARWQGALAHLHSLEFAANVAATELEKRAIPSAEIDFGVLGTTVPQPHCFYGLPWVMGMMGASAVGGPTINQACATSARCLQTAAQEVALDQASCALVVAADRTSNGPHLYYPDPSGFGGSGQTETWVLENFQCDPFAGVAMVETAENVARKYGVSTAEQHDVTLLRFGQYAQARAGAFQKRYMTLPFAVPDARLRRTQSELSADEGVFETSAEKLAQLRPVLPDGTVTSGGQTHPADGNAGMLVTTQARARDLASVPEIEVKLSGFGQARAEKAFMPEAPVPAARRALHDAGTNMRDVALVTTHNPFAVNDVVFARELDFPLERMNAHGCSLIWGHPQGPTGLRSVIELIEGLAERGGGIGLFSGCAAGDTAMALVVEVTDARRT